MHCKVTMFHLCTVQQPTDNNYSNSNADTNDDDDNADNRQFMIIQAQFDFHQMSQKAMSLFT